MPGSEGPYWDWRRGRRVWICSRASEIGGAEEGRVARRDCWVWVRVSGEAVRRERMMERRVEGVKGSVDEGRKR